MVFVACAGRQSWVKSTYSGGLDTRPCGTPLFRVRVEDVCFPNLTFWGQLVMKSRVQLQTAVHRPLLWSLDTSALGITILKARLKSTKSILTYVLEQSRCSKAVWRCKADCKLILVQGSRDDAFNTCQNQLLEALG